tara:strand:- start:81 stop:461 length:381 start_codon:yes stop_codon:yes gene_type:complete
LIDALEAIALPGIDWSPVTFEPTFDKWTGQPCQGIELQVKDPCSFRPYQTTLALIAEVARLWPEAFSWIGPPYEYEMEKMPVDIVTGNCTVREAIETGQLIAMLDEVAAADRDTWWTETSSIRIYD